MFARLVLVAALLSVTSNNVEAGVDSIDKLWPICNDPAAVELAGKAQDEKNLDEIKRLGCVSKLPAEVWVYVLSCEATARLYYGERLGHEIEWNDKLPESVCEIQAWWPGVWIKLYYTHYMNIK